MYNEIKIQWSHL